MLPPCLGDCLVTVFAESIGAIIAHHVDAVSALVLGMASTISLSLTIRAVDRLSRYSSAPTLARVLDVAPSTSHPLRSFFIAFKHFRILWGRFPPPFR